MNEQDLINNDIYEDIESLKQQEIFDDSNLFEENKPIEEEFLKKFIEENLNTLSTFKKSNLVSIVDDFKLIKKEKEEEQNYFLKKTNIEKYAVNLTDLANKGKLNETFGRQKELEQVFEILARRQKNNPVLIGEPGVGKTSIIELFAIKLIKNLVPFIFLNKKIISLDLTKMLAGATYRGQFEKRLLNFMDEIFKATNLIVFIDEIHQIVGSNQGSTEKNTQDTANILKPILSRSGFQCIGASTPKEYQVIRNDAALNRRFQPIIVEEPSISETIEILYNIRSNLETYHNVEISPSALKAAVELSSQYIYDRFLPDKAIDLLDLAASKIVIKMTTINNSTYLEALINNNLLIIEKLKGEAFRKGDISTEFILQQIQNIYRQVFLKWIKNPKDMPEFFSNEKNFNNNNEFLKLIELIFLGHVDKLLFLSSKKDIKDFQENILKKDHLELTIFKEFLINLNPILQKNLIQSLIKLGEIDLLKHEKDTIFSLLGFYGTKEGQLCLNNVENSKEIYSNVKYQIQEKDIENIIAQVTGIPIGNITNKDKNKLLNLEISFKQKIIGQEDAIHAIVNAIRRSRLGIQNPNRPIASFLFCGPTGVGKTEITKVLADIIFGSEKNMIRFDMSEFMEKFGVTRLIGAPAGYIGYEEGGQLTNAVFRNPSSVILFDEIEKAHPDILTILLQILDDGRLTDSQKKLVKFDNTIIILTSNVGAQEIQEIIKNNKNIINIENNLFKKDEYINSIEFLDSPIKKNYLFDIHGRLHKQFEKSITKFKNYELIKTEISNEQNITKQSILNSEDLKSMLKNAVLNNLQTAFLPEFLNRLDDIIIFQPLKLEEIYKICDLMIEQIILRLKKKSINLVVTKAVIIKLGNEGYNPTFGARPLRRLITKHIEDLVSTFLLEKKELINMITININLDEKNNIIIENII